MNTDDFEKQLQHQRMRTIPPEWREEILAAARRVRNNQLSVPDARRTPWWRELLWPCPRAWAVLAAVWMMILALNVVTREPDRVAGARPAPPAREVLMALKERRRMFVELAGPSVPVEPPRPFVPRPRSELRRRDIAV